MMAGRRHTRVLVQRLRQSTEKGGGGHALLEDGDNWEPANEVGDGGKLWASVVPRGSREFFRGEQMAADITHQVSCLWVSGKHITPGMRLKIGERVLHIAEPPRNEMERNHTLTMACTEVVEGGS